MAAVPRYSGVRLPFHQRMPRARASPDALGEKDVGDIRSHGSYLYGSLPRGVSD